MCRKFVAFFMGRNRMCLWHAWFVATSLGLGRCSMRTLTQLNHNHSHKHNMPGIQAANMLRIRCVIMWAIEMISCTLLLYFDLTTDTPHGLICVMWMWRVRSEQISQQFVADDSCVLLLDITILTWRKNAPDIYLIHPAICICRPLNAKCRLLWRLQCSALFVIFSSRAVMLQHERNSLRWMATGVWVLTILWACIRYDQSCTQQCSQHNGRHAQRPLLRTDSHSVSSLPAAATVTTYNEKKSFDIRWCVGCLSF